MKAVHAISLVAIMLLSGCTGGSPEKAPQGALSSCLDVCDKGFNDQGPDLAACKDRCYVDEAEGSGDVRMCLKVQDAELAEGCVSRAAETAEDPSLCSSAKTDEYRLLCIRNVAVAKGDSSVCGLITGDDEFKDSCVSWVAAAKKDPSVCDGIKDERYKQSCVSSAG